MASFYLMGNTTGSVMFGCVLLTEHKTIVIDGGTVKDSDQMAQFLQSHSRSHVDAWFFTHPHHDHIGCFVDLRNHIPSISVGTLYHHFPTLDGSVKPRTEEEASLWEDVRKWKSEYRVHIVEAGETFFFDEIQIRVLRVYNPDISGLNESSAVYRLDGAVRSILILGDLGVNGGNELLERCSLDLLRTDYTQMAHHGQDGVSKEFYDRIHPRRCIWPTPKWLWNNDLGDSFDTARFFTVRTREWMDALGVTEHFVEKDGIQTFEF